MRQADRTGDVEAALALLARPDLSDPATVSVRQDEGAFSATIEARAELPVAGEGEREQALGLAADQAYRSVLAAGGQPDPTPNSLEFLAEAEGWLARASVQGRINDFRKLATPSFVEPGDFAYILGSASDSGSLAALYAAIRAGVSGRMLRTCRALGSPGGLAFGLAAACLPASLGLRALMDDLPGAPDDIEGLLFGSEGSRCIAGVRREDRERFERSFTGLPHRLLGVTTSEPCISFSRNGRILLTLHAKRPGYAVAAHW